MKLLFDQNISFRIVKKLELDFPESEHVSDCGLQNRADPEIWEYARKNQFSIVTYDADFFDMSVMNGHPPKIIWIRFGNTTTQHLAKAMKNNKKVILHFLADTEPSSTACLELC